MVILRKEDGKEVYFEIKSISTDDATDIYDWGGYRPQITVNYMINNEYHMFRHRLDMKIFFKKIEFTPQQLAKKMFKKVEKEIGLYCYENNFEKAFKKEMSEIGVDIE